MGRFVFTSLFLSFLCGVVFWLDLRGYFSDSYQPIAFVQQGQGVVRHLRNREFSWDRIFQGQDVGNKDLISTGADGEARLKLYSGGEILVSPNTTLVITQESGDFQLKFLSAAGRVRVTEELVKKVKIAKRAPAANSTNAVIEPTVDQIEVIKEVPEQAPLLANEKAVQVKDSADLRNLESSLKQSEIEKFAQLPPAPELLEPLSALRVDETDAKELGFKWKLSGAQEADDLAFEFLIRGPLTPEGTAETRVTSTKEWGHTLRRLKPGKYEWSVRSVKAREFKSPVPDFRSFEIRTLAQLRQDNFFVYPVEVQ